MKKLKLQFSEDLLITQPSKSVRDPIPSDLLIDILCRVPAKSIARFRCVSKFWESILGRPYFTELFLTKSVARPRLFFAFRKKLFTLDKDNHKELFVFSSPQPQNPDDNSTLVATPYKAFPKRYTTEICSISLYGLVVIWSRGDNKVPVICNPITGESITLPKVKAKCNAQAHLFGFDPIKKQFKLLCVIESGYRTPNAYYVLTLETRERSWRTIRDPLPPNHFPASNEICINGVVYYRAYFERSRKTVWKIVCFDFTSETFCLIYMDKNMLQNEGFTFFNYQGLLGAYQRMTLSNYREESVLWVLEDAGKHKWSKRILELSPSVDKIFDQNSFVGMTGTGELVFSSPYLSNPFHIFYYSIERKTFTRFNIQGFEEFRYRNHVRVDTFLDYVENIKFMEMC